MTIIKSILNKYKRVTVGIGNLEQQQKKKTNLKHVRKSYWGLLSIISWDMDCGIYLRKKKKTSKYPNYEMNCIFKKQVKIPRSGYQQVWFLPRPLSSACRWPPSRCDLMWLFLQSYTLLVSLSSSSYLMRSLPLRPHLALITSLKAPSPSTVTVWGAGD